MEEAAAAAAAQADPAQNCSQGVARFGLVPVVEAALAAGRLQSRQRSAAGAASPDADEDCEPPLQQKCPGSPLKPLPSCVTDCKFVGRG